MDLWDVVKLLVRRWLVAMPLLLLTLGAMGWTAVTVTPNHTAQGSVLLLPPTTAPATPEGGDRTVNPWTTDSLAGAVVTLLRSRTLEEQLAGEGHDATWEAGRDIQFWSMINFEVTSPTADDARSAVARLAEVVAHEVHARQAEYSLTDGELVTTVTLAAGDSVEVARGNQLRAMIVVLFAGGLLTIGATIAFDAMAKARRSQGRVAGKPVEAAQAVAEPPVPVHNGARAPVAGKPKREAADEPVTVGHRHIYGAQMQPIAMNNPTTGAHLPEPRPQPPDNGATNPTSRWKNDDATVILPLSNVTGDDQGEHPARDAPERPWR